LREEMTMIKTVLQKALTQRQ